ncbi:MAG: aldo/keto reductase [Chthoniobacterales bacterium]
MITRRFGRTDLEMPVLSCGGMRYQHSWNDKDAGGITPEGQANLEECIRKALASGINHIETARGYGTSEVQLGKILPLLPRGEMIIQTKVAPSSAADFRATFDQSMDNLQLEHVDLLSIHGINNRECWEETIRPGGALEAARQIIHEGRATFLGFSTHAPCDLIEEIVESDAFDYVNLHWYFMNRTNWSAVEAATRHDMGVFIISPTEKGGCMHQPSEKLSALCSPYSPMVFNDLYCLMHPEVHTLSIGAARPSDFDEHLKILPLMEHKDTWDRVRETAERLEEEFLRTNASPMPARWDWDLPPFGEVPGGINLQEIVRLRALDRAFDMQAYGKLRYNLLGNGGHWFPGINAAEFDEAAIGEIGRKAGYPSLVNFLHEAHDRFGDTPRKRLQQN